MVSDDIFAKFVASSSMRVEKASDYIAHSETCEDKDLDKETLERNPTDYDRVGKENFRKTE